MYTVTSSEFFTFNVNNSLFVAGQTGSGKSYLVEKLMRSQIKAKSPEELKLALFDFKQTEYKNYVEANKLEEYLYMPVIQESNDALDKLEEISSVSIERSSNGEKKPLLFIVIDECDAAIHDLQRFSDSVRTINNNAEAANIKLIYITSRLDESVIPKKLLNTFELLLLGQMPDKGYYNNIGFDISEMRLLTSHDFNIIEQAAVKENINGHDSEE